MPESLSEELARMRDFIAHYPNGEPCDECGAVNSDAVSSKSKSPGGNRSFR
jgi:hypothetical protein